MCKFIMAVYTTYRLDAEVRCLHKIETRGAVVCGVLSEGPTHEPRGFQFYVDAELQRLTILDRRI